MAPVKRMLRSQWLLDDQPVVASAKEKRLCMVKRTIHVWEANFEETVRSSFTKAMPIFTFIVQFEHFYSSKTRAGVSFCLEPRPTDSRLYYQKSVWVGGRCGQSLCALGESVAGSNNGCGIGKHRGGSVLLSSHEDCVGLSTSAGRSPSGADSIKVMMGETRTSSIVDGSRLRASG